MNTYTATTAELIAALETMPGKVLQACCSPVRPNPADGGTTMIPARSDAVLTEAQIIDAARKDPRQGIGAARHLLPKSVLLECAKAEPAIALQFARDRFTATQIAELEAMLPKDGE